MPATAGFGGLKHFHPFDRHCPSISPGLKPSCQTHHAARGGSCNAVGGLQARRSEVSHSGGDVDGGFVAEAELFAHPDEADGADGAGAVLGDDEVGFAGAVAGVVGVRTVQEHDDVGVLLDGA